MTRMSKKVSWGAAVSLMAVTAAVTVSLTYVYAMRTFNTRVADVNARQAMYIKLSEIDQKTRQDYIGTLDEKALTDGICAGYVGGLGNARYLTAQKYKEYLDANSTRSIGVGVHTIQDDDGNMEVVEVLPNSPAEKADLKKGDTIIAMDGKEISRITYGAALNKLDGTAGSKVSFRILRKSGTVPDGGGTSSAQSDSQSLTITVSRAEYVERTLTYSMINGNVAYLKISDFAKDTPDHFNTALSKLIKEGACGIIVDLRSNSGGLMQSAASVLDTLLPAGNTVSYKDKTGKITVEYTSKPNEVNLPISVVVNADTYGAAEIFASDVKDFKKGLLVGEKTAGYGTKDESVPLSDGSAIILSTANYLTVGGQTFTGKGISVDVKKSLDVSQQSRFVRNQLAFEDDPQIQAAVTALARQGASVQKQPGASSAPASGSDAGKD